LRFPTRATAAGGASTLAGLRDRAYRERTPRSILDKRTDALDKALDDEKVRNRLVDIGGDIPSKEQRGQRALATLVESEIAYWKSIIRAANVVLDWLG
jgi:tripartite-type tricarboxylate transporter receptor subunit TctC